MVTQKELQNKKPGIVEKLEFDPQVMVTDEKFIQNLNASISYYYLLKGKNKYN
jgi:hypothetical protein